jgi:hypothetical protein
MLLRILDEEICAAVDGRKRRMTRREAMLRGLVDQATAGDIRATRIVQERDVQARKARDTARSAEGGVDTVSLTLGLADIIRRQERSRGDIPPRDAHGDEAPARTADERADKEPRQEEAEGEDQLPPAIEEGAANVPECPRNTARGAEPNGLAPARREVPAPPPQEEKVFGNAPTYNPQPSRVRGGTRSNEPLIPDERPLTRKC